MKFKGRAKRYIVENAIYFVTSNTHAREPFFADPQCCEIAVRNITLTKVHQPFKLYAFAIMPEHFHAIIHPKQNQSISKIMQSFKQNTTKNIKETLGIDFSWQKSFYDEMILTPEQLVRSIENVERNYLHHDLPEFEAYSSVSYENLVDMLPL